MAAITSRSARKKFREFYKTHEQQVFFEILGKGTANSEVLNYFGLEETEKILFLSIVTGDTWKRLKRGLIIDMKIDVPGTGIAFCSACLRAWAAKRHCKYLIQEQPFEKEEETALKETDYELMIAIANQGYIDTVMEAAREANAGGGTVVHAKGTGTELARKYLGVSLVEEKEMIFIVTRSSQKAQIMKAIMEKTGLKSKEKAIVFSLPVSSVVGLRMTEEDIKDDLV